MIFETYAERKRKLARSGEPEVYTYDDALPQLRHQITMAIREGIGRYRLLTGDEFQVPPNNNDLWSEIDRICRKEIFAYQSVLRQHLDIDDRIFEFLRTAKMDDFLSVVEIACVGLSIVDDQYDGTNQRGAVLTGPDAIKEINGRFEQHAVGYQFENREIIRIDSKLTHAEIIKPALNLLTADIFQKANEDFMTAHRHYRAGEFKDCVTSANRAFESVLKAICDVEQWTYAKGDRAGELITMISNRGLFTHDFDRSMTAYVGMLKAGLPSVRNDAGGHGESLAAASVTTHIARFALNLTAPNIVFIGEAYKLMKERQAGTKT